MSSVRKRAEELIRKIQENGDINPYLFSIEHRNPTPERPVRLPHEEEILREQRRTIFDQDESVQELFGDDFETYNQSIDSPELLIESLEKRIQELSDALSAQGIQLVREVLPDDMVSDELYEGEGDWEEDPLYEKANVWAHRLFKEANTLYNEQGIKDPHVYRVLVNVFLVPAKIVYASSGAYIISDDSDIEDLDARISLQGYTISIMFLRRIREALLSLVWNQCGPVSVWQQGVVAADEIAFEIQLRMIALAKRLTR